MGRLFAAIIMIGGMVAVAYAATDADRCPPVEPGVATSGVSDRGC